jgi:hypothetical protein
MNFQADGVVEKICKSVDTGLWEVHVRVAKKRVVRYIGLKKKPGVRFGQRVKAGDSIE